MFDEIVAGAAPAHHERNVREHIDSVLGARAIRGQKPRRHARDARVAVRHAARHRCADVGVTFRDGGRGFGVGRQKHAARRAGAAASARARPRSRLSIGCFTLVRARSCRPSARGWRPSRPSSRRRAEARARGARARSRRADPIREPPQPSTARPRAPVRAITQGIACSGRALASDRGGSAWPPSGRRSEADTLTATSRTARAREVTCEVATEFEQGAHTKAERARTPSPVSLPHRPAAVDYVLGDEVLHDLVESRKEPIHGASAPPRRRSNTRPTPAPPRRRARTPPAVATAPSVRWVPPPARYRQRSSRLGLVTNPLSPV